jgi:putative ABC transport system permease protein
MHKSDVFLMSLGAIGSNKLRSFLTLVGIVLGVASIIGVMTAITIMQDTMEKEMSVLGAQTASPATSSAAPRRNGHR